MTAHPMSWHGIAQALGAVALLVLSACSPIQLGSRTLDFGAPPAQTIQAPATMPAGPSQSFGRGPVKVALLLPLSGDNGIAAVGQSLANASRLAIAFIEANPNIAENITITLRDTGTSVAGATAAASAAVTDGARLILGPLRADQVTAAGAVARSAGLPLIGFSNNPTAASPGVYLLSVLPDMEMKRSMGWLMAQGRRGIAGVFPATEFGQAQETAFRQQAVAAGFAPQAVYTFSNVEEAQQIVNQALPLIQKGMIDTLFLPDRATAPSFGVLLGQAGISGDALQIVGSADWEGDPTIATASQLSGAIYPTVDPAGMLAISADYQRQFGTQPHALATIAYTATILANVNTLSMANPPYNPALMTSPTGFNGRDGVFRFLGNGKSEYALAIKRIAPGGAQLIEGAKL
ncbi:MAG: penicillin-binding protein activator [Alphaproteobacteria bacterium]|nr:penicillin-binding protein activator [Alphaproteobacteria bacterium]MBU1562139.1 penicillin-binding protein activator [Alphaproteobacteria bacterium]MBU2301840.1 penicillin-binding protein activator [Alphaproteobacteria bacterium]MBU2368426.1 penicillin-binding protein activator [Alphaproteobacteria bacterium]